MTFNQADEIVHIWGRYLEYASGKLNLMFGMRIPESFLPFPKENLLEALNIMAEFYQNNNNKRGVELMRETATSLSTYIDDEEALLQAAKNFNDPEWRKAILPIIKRFQFNWISTQSIPPQTSLEPRGAEDAKQKDLKKISHNCVDLGKNKAYLESQD